MHQRRPLPQPTRHRKSTPRSKTGCITCKIRRLKCGEEKPSCLRCTKSGWHCDGYAPVPSTTSQELMIPGHANSSSGSLSPSPGPSQNIPLGEREQLYLQYFLDDVVTQLTIHDSNFWRATAIQQSSNTGSIRHGIIAIAALAKSAPKRIFGGYKMGFAQGSNREFALQQYEIAIAGLRESFTTTDRDLGISTTLLSCLVLAFFDSFIGHGDYALRQIQFARDVMVNANKPCPTWITPSGDYDERLRGMFLRLDIQTLLVTGIDESRTFLRLVPHAPNIILPAYLSNIEQAQQVRDLVIWECELFLYQAARYHLAPPNQIPPQLIHQRNYLIHRLNALHELIDGFVIIEKQDFNIHPLYQAASLKIQSTILLIQLTTCLRLYLEAPETACDALFPHFAFLVTFGKRTLDYENIMNLAMPEGETFTFDCRIIIPLMVTATKCRDPALRRQAIALLQTSHRREGLLDSRFAVQICQWIMTIEEESMAPNGYIPEEARVWSHCVEFKDVGAVVRCRQNYKGIDGEMRWRWKEKVMV